jgi:hypothetical protein
MLALKTKTKTKKGKHKYEPLLGGALNSVLPCGLRVGVGIIIIIII